MCCTKAKWKREVVKNHKFDFVCIEDFKENNIITKIRYCFLYLIVIKTILVYVADLWTAGILLIFNRWSSLISPSIPFYISKWIYVGCIFMSFFLLAWDWKKAKSIIASRDISYAFTSTIAYRFYTLRSYSHYCFFCQINRQKKKADELAFFVFFTFKGWKKLVLAEAPRQIINAITLYSMFNIFKTTTPSSITSHYSIVEMTAMSLMTFTTLVYLISASKIVIAFILYIPLLLFYIRGNLKEYCCHKIDKRIGELLKKNSRKRQQMIKTAVAKGDRLKKKNQDHPIRQPTLPTIDDNYDIENPSTEFVSFIPNNSQFNDPLEQPYESQFNNQMPMNLHPSHPRTNLHELEYNLNFRPPRSDLAYNSSFHSQQINSPGGLAYNSNLHSQRINPPGLAYNSNLRNQQTNSPDLAYNSNLHFQRTNFPGSNFQQTNSPGFAHDSGSRPPAHSPNLPRLVHDSNVHYRPPRTNSPGSNNATVSTRYVSQNDERFNNNQKGR